MNQSFSRILDLVRRTHQPVVVVGEDPTSQPCVVLGLSAYETLVSGSVEKVPMSSPSPLLGVTVPVPAEVRSEPMVSPVHEPPLPESLTDIETQFYLEPVE